MMSNLSIEGLSGLGASPGLDAVKEARQFREAGQQSSSTGESAKSFADILTKSVEKVNEHQLEADRAIQETAAGRNKNVHETLLALERADASLKLAIRVHNKVLDAYREI